MYDPTDARTEALFSAILQVLRGAPETTAKQALATLLEEAALVELLAREGAPFPGDSDLFSDLLARRWEEVEALRNEKAASFLYSLQRNEF
ncbi:MAG: hypothetical protein ACP5VN_04595 [Acidobacteriota bacterium]